MVRLSLLVLGFLVSQTLCFGLPKSYEVILVSFSSYPDDNQLVVDLSNLRIKGRERAANGTIIINEDMDDSFKVTLHSFSDPSGNGQFKQNPMGVPATPVCKGLKEIIKKYTYPSLKPGVNTDFPFDGSECPVRKGTYYIKDMLVDPTPFPDFMPRGFGKGVFYVTKGDQKMGVAEFVIEVRDRIF